MNRLFNLDSPIMQFLSRVADLVILNLLWLVLCVPIITAGAATTALYRVCLDMAAESDSGIVSTFFRTFKREFKPATLTWLVLLVPTILCALNIWLLLSGALNASIIMPAICLLPLLILVFVYAYVFGYIALFENGVWQTLRNALLLSIANLPRTLLMSLLNLIPVIWLLIHPVSFLRVGIIWILIGFALTAYVNARILRKVFTKFSPEFAERDQAGRGGEES